MALVEAEQVLDTGDKDMSLCPLLCPDSLMDKLGTIATRKAYEYKVTFIIFCCPVQYDNFLSV